MWQFLQDVLFYTHVDGTMVNWQTLHIWLSWTSKLVDPSMTSCSTLCSRWSWLSINVTCWIWLTFLCIGEISKVCHGTPPHLRYFSRWFKRKPHLLMVEHYLHCRATTFQICFPDSWGSKLASFWKVATTYINQDIFCVEIYQSQLLSRIQREFQNTRKRTG